MMRGQVGKGRPRLADRRNQRQSHTPSCLRRPRLNERFLREVLDFKTAERVVTYGVPKVGLSL
jgi:hypothetical protein